MLLCSKLLPQATWCVLPYPVLPAKPLAGGVGVNLTQVCFDQAEGLLNEVVELVDRGKGVNTDDAEELFEAWAKVGRCHLQPFHQSIHPLPSGIVEAVEPQEDEQEVLLGGTEGVVEDQHVVALRQPFLLPGGAKAQMFPYHRHGQCVWIGSRLLLPPGDERRVGEGKSRAQGCQALLLGEPSISVFQHSSQEAFGSLDRRVSHVDGNPFLNVSRLPTSCFAVRGRRVPVSSPSTCDNVPALLCRWWFSPEDGQVDIGEVISVSPRDRPLDKHGCHFAVGMRVRGDLLRQGITPATFFLHQKPPDSLLSST